MKSSFLWLSILAVVIISIVLTTPALATTMDSFLSDVFAKELVPDAAVFFGKVAQSGEAEIQGTISGPYEVYKGIPASSVETYVNVMEQYYHFSINQTDLSEKKVNQWIFDKEDYRLLLLYSYDMNQVVLVYQKDFDVDSIDNMLRYSEESLKTAQDELAQAQAEFKAAEEYCYVLTDSINALEADATACKAAIDAAKEGNRTDILRDLEGEYKAKIMEITDAKLELITVQNEVDAATVKAQECEGRVKSAEDFANTVRKMLEK